MRPTYGLIAALVLVLSSTARAHQSDAMLDVAEVSGGEPSLVLTTYGYVRREADGMRFECPARYGGDARATLVAQGDTVVALSDGEVRVSHDAGCSYQRVPSELYATGVVNSGTEFGLSGNLLLAERGDEIVLATLENDALRVVHVFDDGEPIDMFVDGDVVWLTGARPRAAMWRVDASLDVTRVEGLPHVELSWLTVRAVHGDELMLAATEGEVTTLWRATKGDVLQVTTDAPSGIAVQGPVRVGDLWLASFDGFFAIRADDDGWVLGDPSDATCLSSRDGVPFACALGGLYEIERADRGAPLSHEVVVMDDIVGPSRRCGATTPDIERACNLEWQHVAADMGRDAFPDNPNSVPEAFPDNPNSVPNCTAAAPQGGGMGAWAVCLVLSLLVRRAWGRPRR